MSIARRTAHAAVAVMMEDFVNADETSSHRRRA
jgi:hypothetical protein